MPSRPLVGSIPASSRSQRLITQIGVLLALAWVGASIAAAVTGKGLPTEERPALVWYAVGNHPFSQGIVPVQLLTYSFIHHIGWHLVENLIVLWLMVNIARRCMTPAGFVRLYSLGSVCGGLVYLLMTSSVEQPLPLIGAGTALMAMLGALAVLKPRFEIYLLFIWRTRLVWIAVAMGALVLLELVLRREPGLSLGMIAGLAAGVLYALVEKLWTRYEQRR